VLTLLSAPISFSHHYQCFPEQLVRSLMRSIDVDVALAAAEVLFNVCVPANSVINSLNDDYNDMFEVRGAQAMLFHTLFCM
jgi:hypothetical protein